MNYKGKELKEYTGSDPIFFDPPKHMVCWTNPADDPMECIVFSYDPRITLCVSARTPWNECRSFRHCAEIPEEYYALVVVEHRAVSGINRYGLGKFVTREDAKSVMDSMVELLGGDPAKGSKDIYIVPLDAVKDFPIFHETMTDEYENIPRYITDAYYKAVGKFLGGPIETPRIKDLPKNAGEVYSPRETNLTFDARQALTRKLRADTGVGYIHCKQTLEQCSWIYDKAYYKLVGEYPAGEEPTEPTDECSSTNELSNADKAALVNKLRQKTERGMFPCKRALEECGWDYDKAYALVKELPPVRASSDDATREKTTPHVMDIDEMVGKSERIDDLMSRTGWGAYHCRKALEACSWNLDDAERMLREKFKYFASNK